MAFLVDTSILVRLANASDLQHSVAANAVLALHRRAELLHITPQILIEFRNVATRPKSANGAGFTIEVAEAYAADFEANFPLLDDVPIIFPGWKALVGTLGIIGKQVHDARLVAVCHAHSVTHLLTMNVNHFTRMSTFGPGLVVVDPASL